MKKLLLIVITLLFLTGCYSVPQSMKDGSELLVKAYKSLGDDWKEARKHLGIFFELCTEKPKLDYLEAEKKFLEGFEAVGLAVEAMNDAIQALDAEE